MTSPTLRTIFGEEVQVDLLFYRRYVVLHLIDVCARCTVACALKSRSADEIVQQLQTRWFSIFGPPRLIVADQEGGVANDHIAAWLERRGVALTLRALGQHAQVVERHHEILRQQTHTDDGLRVRFGEILAESIFVEDTAALKQFWDGSSMCWQRNHRRQMARQKSFVSGSGCTPSTDLLAAVVATSGA